MTQIHAFFRKTIKFTRTVTILAAAVEGGPINFSDRRGRFTLTVQDNSVSANVFSLDIEGGFGRTGPNSDYSSVTGTEINCTVNITSTPNNINITETTSGRTYTLVFSGFLTVLPTIQKTGGGALGSSIGVTVEQYEVVPNSFPMSSNP